MTISLSISKKPYVSYATNSSKLSPLSGFHFLEQRMNDAFSYKLSSSESIQE